MLDPVVHAALVTIGIWLVHLLFAYIGIDLGGETETALAEIIVGYILSLFGWSLYTRFVPTVRGVARGEYNYHPPLS